MRFGLATAPVTLDPRFATDATSERICRLLYRRLVDFDENYRPVPVLAGWAQLSPTHYRFTLGARRSAFHDGSPLTAADVKATYDSILDPSLASPHRGSLAMIERIEVLEEDRVDFHLSRADPLFPGRLAIGILPRRLIEAGHDFVTAPVGNGPLRFIARPDDTHLVLERIGDGMRVEFLAVPNPTVRALKLARGEIDLLQGDLPPEMIGWLTRQPRIAVTRAQGDTFAYLGFNLRDAVLARPEIREAIALAVDREAIVRFVFQDRARPAAGLLPPDHWAAEPDLAPPARDLERARRLLRAAGYGAGRPLRIVYKTSNDPLRVRLATILQAQLREAGIEVDLRTHDWGTFYGDIKAGRFQMYSLAWVGLKLPDIFRYAFHSASMPPRGANRGGYASVRVDALIERAETAADAGTQAALYREIQRQLAHDLPFAPLWYEDIAVAARGDIEGYRPAADGNYDALMTVRRPTP